MQYFYNYIYILKFNNLAETINETNIYHRMTHIFQNINLLTRIGNITEKSVMCSKF